MDDPSGEVRRQAVRFCGKLAHLDTPIRDALLPRLGDADGQVADAAIVALQPLAAQDPAVRAGILARAGGDVRQSAIAVLSPIISTDEEARAAVVQALEHDDSSVRYEAICAVCGSRDLALADRLVPVLAFDDDSGFMHFFGESTPRESVVRYFADAVRKDSAIHAKIASLFEAADWHLRLSAAEVFAAAGPEYLEPVLPQLLAMLEDHRGLDSWSARIAAAEHLLNE